MRRLYITCGISGSGKSTWTASKHPKAYVVNPDSIRKELTGNVSDQSRNKEVFEMAYRDLCIEGIKAEEVVWDATNLNIAQIVKIANMARGANLGYSGSDIGKIVLVIFKDSMDWELCLERVRNALASGEDRSNTDVDVDIESRDSKGNKVINKMPLLKSMHKKFMDFWYLVERGNSTLQREGIEVEVI